MLCNKKNKYADRLYNLWILTKIILSEIIIIHIDRTLSNYLSRRVICQLKSRFQNLNDRPNTDINQTKVF